jgi:hypothetical protein
MGAILDAAVTRYGPDITVSDPFCGGGTVTFEAVRRGLRAYAQDLYPWPTHGLATALRPTDRTELVSAANQLLEQLAPLRAAYRGSDGRDLSHVLRVRATTCPHCRREYFLFPELLVSVASRSSADDFAFFGCIGCGAVTRRKRDIASFRCAECGVKRHLRKASSGCPHCCEHVPSGHTSAHRWHPVLVQEVVVEGSQSRARLRPANQQDPVSPADASGLHIALDKHISDGVETRRLLNAGFVRWSELYSARQASILLRALADIRQSPYAPAVKDRLALAVLGAAEMPAFVSRWDRFNLKPFEGLANHRYSNSNLVVECNPLSPVGRGTLSRRFAGAIKALDWLALAAQPKVLSTKPHHAGRRPINWDVLVATGSSQKQSLRDGSANIALTDPPYHDDVQYGELARLFHAWLSVYIPLEKVDERPEAVPNSGRGSSSADYEATIAACFAESRRTLTRKGCLVLTFHNRRLAAWRALAGALCRAGFVVRALAVVRSENGNDHCKRDVNALLHDLVIECIPSASTFRRPRLAFTPHTVAEKNLAAAGFALAECVSKGDCENLRERYRRELAALRTTTRLIEC